MPDRGGSIHYLLGRLAVIVGRLAPEWVVDFIGICTECKVEKLGVAPWYFEELAKVYRKKKEYKKEVAVLKRFAKQKHTRGVKPKKLLERLEKAKKLAVK